MKTNESSGKKKVVVAVGGNAILENGQSGSFEEQSRNILRTAAKLASIIQGVDDYEIVAITHGNGPQVGLFALQQDIASHRVPQLPMHALIAMTQGQIGYMLQQAMQNEFLSRGIKRPVISIVTQTLVDKNDAEFSKERPSKPIGPFYTYEEAREMIEHKGYAIIQVKPVGEKVWRRVVPSPFPLQIVESEVLRTLIGGGCLAIAGGGGGVPVVQNGHGYVGVEGVVDKDLLAGLLGKTIGASVLMILTDIDRVKLNFGKPDEVGVPLMTLEDARTYYRQGQFLDGSMGPKVRSAIDFLDGGGDSAIITSIDRAVDALRGNAGTRIVSTLDPQPSK